jgi:hypothetical protein
MSDLIGYVSSFFVTFGLGIGFVIGGLIFAFGLAYAFMLIFKRSRRAIREDRPAFVSVRNRLAPARTSPKPSRPMNEQNR